MKKIAVLMIALILALSTVAFAAEIKPLENVNMEEDLVDCTLNVSFLAEDVTEKDIIALIYDEVMYDAVEVSQLQIGDTITYTDGDITVESIGTDESGATIINGGYEDSDNGISLVPGEGGVYYTREWDTPAYMLKGQAQLMLADEIIYRHWQELEDGGISDEMLTQTVAAADLPAFLAEQDGGEFYCSTTVELEGAKVVAINVNYVP